jgi:hypothetical protein
MTFKRHMLSTCPRWMFRAALSDMRDVRIQLQVMALTWDAVHG